MVARPRNIEHHRNQPPNSAAARKTALRRYAPASGSFWCRNACWRRTRSRSKCFSFATARGGVDDVVDLLAAKYVADRVAISADVIAMLQNLADKGFLVEAWEAGVLSPTFTSVAPLPYDSADGLSILRSSESAAETFGIPLAALAELTHRCSLQCPYCSNPVELERGGSELTTAEWKKVLTELAEIGVLQFIFQAASRPRARIWSSLCGTRATSASTRTSSPPRCC